MYFRSRIQPTSVAAALGGSSFLGYVVWSAPAPYPPFRWSAEIENFPDHVRAGLGPFQYYDAERGAVTPVDRIPDHLAVSDVAMMHRLKPGLDCGDAKPIGASGVVATTPDSYEKIDPKLLAKVRAMHARTERPTPPAPKNDPTLFISVRRNLAGVPFSSSISFEERREVEQRVLHALADLPGTYFAKNSLSNNNKFPATSPLTMDLLRAAGLMFEAPWDVYDLSSGSGRHWPDARGVWVAGDAAVWVNREDHIEVVGTDWAAIKQILNRLETAEVLAKDDTHGWLTMKPENAGNGVTVAAQLVRLPRLRAHPKFNAIWESVPLTPVLVAPDTYNLVSRERFGLEGSESVERARSWIGEILEIEKLLQDPATTKQGLQRMDRLTQTTTPSPK